MKKDTIWLVIVGERGIGYRVLQAYRTEESARKWIREGFSEFEDAEWATSSFLLDFFFCNSGVDYYGIIEVEIED